MMLSGSESEDDQDSNDISDSQSVHTLRSADAFLASLNKSRVGCTHSDGKFDQRVRSLSLGIDEWLACCRKVPQADAAGNSFPADPPRPGQQSEGARDGTMPKTYFFTYRNFSFALGYGIKSKVCSR